jgi:hypothetical protein
VSAIEIAFAGVSLAHSGQMAQELRVNLRREGLPGEALSIAREQPGTMDLGSVLHLAGDAIEYLSVPVHAAAVVHCIYEVCIRERCGVRIRTPKGVVVIGPGEIDLEKLRAFLREAFDATRAE